jgi:hypothetical protein
MPPHLSRIL